MWEDSVAVLPQNFRGKEYLLYVAQPRPPGKGRIAVRDRWLLASTKSKKEGDMNAWSAALAYCVYVRDVSLVTYVLTTVPS